MLRTVLHHALLALFAIAVTTGTVQAACIDYFVQKEGNVCKAYVTNSCGYRVKCNVQIEGYAWDGSLYRESGTVRMSHGEQTWYGISGVNACGQAYVSYCDRW
jgi:hypothetical protein